MPQRVSLWPNSIHSHEFEAEGSPEIVQAQFDAFKDMVLAVPYANLPPPQRDPFIEQTPVTNGAGKQDTAPHDVALDKIMKLEDRIVSLTARPKSADDAILLLLLGQKALRANDGVTGAEIMDGITATGGLQILRVDRALERMGENGDVIVIGERRSKRYRLTNAGLAKARQAANDLLAIVA